LGEKNYICPDFKISKPALDIKDRRNREDFKSVKYLIVDKKTKKYKRANSKTFPSFEGRLIESGKQ
jgi:hypothetical protein